MAEETKPETAPVAPSTSTEVVVPLPDNPVAVPEKDLPPPEEEKSAAEPEKPVPETDKPAEVEPEPEAEKDIAQQVSFKEETNVASELPEVQRKALEELKKLILEACAKREFSAPPPPPPVAAPKEEEKKEEVAVEEQTPKTAEEVAPPASAPAEAVAEEAPKTEEPPKVVEEEAKVAQEAPKTEEPAKVVEEEAKAPVQEAPKTEEPAKVVEEAPKTEEVKKEDEEKTVEAIKETIVEVATPAATGESSKEAETEPEPVAEEPLEPEEVNIWGIPLLADERSDVILLKFLRARDLKVKEAFTMIRNTVRWRKEYGVDDLVENHELGNEYEKVLFTHGVDKEGRPVVYNVFGEFQNKELYQNTFSDAEKRTKFEKSLIVFLEKFIRNLDFSPKGINSFVLVNDLKNSPGFPGYGYGKKDVKQMIDKFLVILQDNYPEFVAKQVCVNTSWWYLAYNWIYVTVFTPRSKSKFVFASPSKTPETLFKYISPEHVPIQYGGHSKIDGSEFSPADPVTEVTIKPGTKHPIEFAFSEATELVWELRVIGWDVSYGAEFLPAKEGGYTLNIAKTKKVAPTDEPVISDTFKATEPGKVVITIDNQSSKKKKLLYRSKVKTSE